jgi:short-subunit dehydrogenase
MPLCVVITGASSGIGRALALQYARQGATIGILGRNRDRLETTASQCQAFGAQVHAAAIDVRERSAMTEWLTGFDRATPVDVLIANAGVMEGTAPGQDIEAADPAYALMQTNVLGTLNTIQPLVAAMISRGHGQIAILSSIAGFIPLPDAPSYSASKAALTNYGLALRALLRPRGIGVSVFCLGYVDTPMILREQGVQPFKMPLDKAAMLIVRGIAKNKALVVAPRFFGYLTRIGGLLPDRIRRHTMKPFRFTVSDPGPPT